MFVKGRYKPFDWVAIQAYVEAGHGFLKSGRIAPRHGRQTTEQALNSSSRLTVKRHLIRAGIIVNRCDWCGLTEWRGQPLSIQIDHINGIKDDHRLENRPMLCPNRHSQASSFGARKIRKPVNSQSNV